MNDADKQKMLEIGQQNLQHLIADIGGEHAFCKLTGMNASYVYNWLKKEPPQTISFKCAKQIEEAFSKTHGWLHDGLLIDSEGNQIMHKKPKQRKKKVTIDYAAMRNRHDQLDTIVAAFIEDTNKAPSETTLLEVMTWSYGKTLK